ncbi:MAG: hypothetical protein DRJ32_07380 [Thermoprotei archaeon]|nr:MAG: hypothetical protein DRJ32_07380 [Thermoprotei archaeon]
MSTPFSSMILDTNLLVYTFISTKVFQRRSLEEEVKACIARELLYSGKLKVLIPSLVAEVELRRALSRMVITRGITNQKKLMILSNTIKYMKDTLNRMMKLGMCEIVDSWNAEILRRAAGYYNRLAGSGVKKWAKGKHQDLIILATAEQYNAIILTTDYDFLRLIDLTKSTVPLYFIEIERNKVNIIRKNIGAVAYIDDVVRMCKRKDKKHK